MPLKITSVGLLLVNFQREKAFGWAVFWLQPALHFVGLRDDWFKPLTSFLFKGSVHASFVWVIFSFCKKKHKDVHFYCAFDEKKNT